MTDKIEYYCHNCREYRTTYCGTDIEIGQEPTQTWPNDQTVCVLQRDREKGQRILSTTTPLHTFLHVALGR